MKDSEYLKERVDEFVKDHGESAVSVLVMVQEGAFSMVPLISASHQDLYLAVGLLEQLKIELLASVPENRPLREPEPADDDPHFAPPEPPKSEVN